MMHSLLLMTYCGTAKCLLVWGFECNGARIMTSPFKKMKRGKAKIKYLKLLEKLRTKWKLKRRNFVVLLPELLHSEVNNYIIILKYNSNNIRIIKIDNNCVEQGEGQFWVEEISSLQHDCHYFLFCFSPSKNHCFAALLLGEVLNFSPFFFSSYNRNS